MSKIIIHFFLLTALFLVGFSNKEAFQNGGKKKILNIYNQPLAQCGNPKSSSGSWDKNGKCSETGGGVHQICINNISKNAPNFSEKTGQSNWSDKRGTENHCVCLGAWSLYAANKNKINKNVLKCNAIPKMSLSKRYVKKFSEGWNKWNGDELTDQVVDGVNTMVKNCYNPKEKNKAQNLKKNYCNFGRNVKSISKSDFYKRMCH